MKKQMAILGVAIALLAGNTRAGDLNVVGNLSVVSNLTAQSITLGGANRTNWPSGGGGGGGTLDEVTTAGNTTTNSVVLGTTTVIGKFTGGATNNAANGNYSFVGGGEDVQANGMFSAIAGGEAIQATHWSFVGGGWANIADGSDSVIGGGDFNITVTEFGVVGGGYNNVVYGPYATISGGHHNTANGDNAVVPGGSYAHATHDNTFVWADGTDTSSSSDNEFTVYASNGIRLLGGDVTIDGKVNATGGIDPPYLLLDAGTRGGIVRRVAREVPPEKATGAVLFFNAAATRLEVYVPATGAFYNLAGNLLTNLPVPAVAGQSVTNYLIDADTGAVVPQISYRVPGWKVKKGYRFNRMDGTFAKVTRSNVLHTVTYQNRLGQVESLIRSNRVETVLPATKAEALERP